LNADLSVSSRTRSSLTGALSFYQFGNSSASAREPMTAPDKDACVDLRVFLDDAYSDLVSAFNGKLLQADRCGEAGGTCTHYDQIISNRFTFSQFSTLF